MAQVKIRELVKYYGKVLAVDKISFDVADGEFFAMLGPSGCGKTTTLRCIAGLERASSGDIFIDDTRVNDVEPKDRDVAMVFQFYAMYPGMTAFEQIAFPLMAHKVPKDEIVKRVKDVAGRIGVAHILGEPTSRLSVDQKQRLALGRAMVRKPKVYLLDEPLTNLDAELRVIMRAELKRVQKDLGATSIFVTHDQIEAISLASKVLVMNLGRIQQVDSPEVLYEKPTNLFVAGFIGAPAMNFVRSAYTEKNGTAFLDAEDFHYDISHLKSYLSERSGSEMVMGVRPEYVTASKEKTENSIPAKVDVAEPLGDRLILNLFVGKHPFKANTRPMHVAPGDTVWISFDKKHVLLFDAKTGSYIV